MGRLKKDDGSVLQDNEGRKFVEVVTIPDYSEPMEDDDGNVPEFVNVSGKIQIVSVPHNPNAAITVERFQKLSGSQWRHLAKIGGNFGNHPPFIERQLNGDGYDPKYLLTSKQMIDEINSLFKQRRIDALIANAVILEDEKIYDDVGRMKPNRGREDRAEVIGAAMHRLDFLNERDREKKRKMGMNVKD